MYSRVYDKDPYNSIKVYTLTFISLYKRIILFRRVMEGGSGVLSTVVKINRSFRGLSPLYDHLLYICKRRRDERYGSINRSIMIKPYVGFQLSIFSDVDVYTAVASKLLP